MKYILTDNETGRSYTVQSAFTPGLDRVWDSQKCFFPNKCSVTIRDEAGHAATYVRPEVKCEECEHLMFSDFYGECKKGHKGIVRPGDSCGQGMLRRKKCTESTTK